MKETTICLGCGHLSTEKITGRLGVCCPDHNVHITVSEYFKNSMLIDKNIPENEMRDQFEFMLSRIKNNHKN